MMTDERNIVSFPTETPSCASCGSDQVSTRHEESSFIYGEGDTAATLSAVIPIHSCRVCEFEFTEGTADDLRHDAVCRHLGVMTPTEVRQVRQALGMSKAEFSRRTGIGEASINRWERGALIQNAAMDGYLYLLGQPGSIEALDFRSALGGEGPQTAEMFPALEINDDVTSRSRQFSL